jgi:curli biogenesis system outer membrane secretion channel CsgG
MGLAWFPQIIRASVAVTLSAGVAGCAVQSPGIQPKEPPQSLAAQRTAQQATTTQAPAVPALKRKVAVGRVTNETNYGRSLLRDQQGDPLGKQVSDLMSKALAGSGAYLVFERPDIGRLQAESRLTGDTQTLIGVDSLIVGSLTEFGRKTIGETGFVSSSKRQVAFAKVDIRLVDVKTAQVVFATSGAGEASTETASTFGFGSQASYDGTLNDTAIRQAVGDAVGRLSAAMNARPWETFILKAEAGKIFLGGGKTQGVREGMQFTVLTQGEQIKSPQTGAFIRLPGQPVARVQVEALFGETDLNEGAIATVISGSLGSHRPDQLVVRFDGAR